MPEVSGWGTYPVIDAQVTSLHDVAVVQRLIEEGGVFIPFGNGRSYGDSALSPHILNTRPHRYFLAFDEERGLLHVEAGALLSDILKVIVPKGWFLGVTPGTKFVTVGGAIASDVHGKNHHIDGCFSDWVEMFNLLLPNGERVCCSASKTPELWRATCGGMGLTGVILDAVLRLKPIRSRSIAQTTVKNANLQETFAAFEQYADAPYSVAWIDCLASGKHLGRSLLMTGAFENDGDMTYEPKRGIDVPFYFPKFVLNAFTVKSFNRLYYERVKENITYQQVDIDTFFYPLDAIGQWNRIYGKQGFVQYQFILPKKRSFEGLEEILHTIAASGKGSFLAVLKLYGKENGNWLSFPLEGYSLALDFKVEPGLFDLLDRLDEIVVKYEGRLYLAKDARMGRKILERGYPNLEAFRKLRRKYDLSDTFESLQSRRLNL